MWDGLSVLYHGILPTGVGEHRLLGNGHAFTVNNRGWQGFIGPRHVPPSSLHSSILAASAITMSYNLLTITKPASTTWQITLHSPPDNRLTNEMLAEVSSALDQIELEWRQSSELALRGGFSLDAILIRQTVTCTDQPPLLGMRKRRKLPGGAVVFTSDLPKFFSNGLDYVNAIKDPNFHWSEGHLLFCRYQSYVLNFFVFVSSTTSFRILQSAYQQDLAIPSCHCGCYHWTW